MKPKPKPDSSAGKRILIVDDDAQIREVFGALLEATGYQVQTAEHALAAVASIVRASPDVILVDIRMPIVDGIELVRELKTHPDSRNIPVIAVTGHDSQETREAALKAGCVHYFAKPVDPQGLLRQIAQVCR
jgi:CheY-like chemotaxis protein